MTKTSVPRRKAKSARSTTVVAARKAPGRKAKRGQKRPPRYVEIAGVWYEKHPQGLLVEGHYLNPQQVELFRGKVEGRLLVTEGWSSIEKTNASPRDWAHEVGLSDFLWLYRPSRQAKEVIRDLSMQITNAALAISSMRGFSFHDSEACAEGVILLGKLAQQAEKKIANLRHFIESIAHEPKGHLQDWTRRETERAARFGAQS